MNKKLFVSAMLVCLLALGLVLIGCPTDDDGGGGSGGGGSIPAGLIGKWSDDINPDRIDFEMTETQCIYGIGGQAHTILGVNGSTITLGMGSTGYANGTFDFALSDNNNTLTISNNTASGVTNGTYNRTTSTDW